MPAEMWHNHHIISYKCKQIKSVTKLYITAMDNALNIQIKYTVLLLYTLTTNLHNSMFFPPEVKMA